MKNKKAIADPVVDFWAILIYIALILLFLIVFSILGGCDNSYENEVIQNEGASTTLKTILLDFVEIPIEGLSEDINYEPNMADLILLAWTDTSKENKINTISSNYIGRIYRNYKLKITYPDNTKKEYGYSEYDFPAGGNYMQTYVNNIIRFSSSPATLIQEPDKLKTETIKTSVLIPTYSNSYINVTLEVYKILKKPIYYHFFFERNIPNYFKLAGPNQVQTLASQSSNQDTSTTNSIETITSRNPSSQEEESSPLTQSPIPIGHDYTPESAGSRRPHE